MFRSIISVIVSFVLLTGCNSKPFDSEEEDLDFRPSDLEWGDLVAVDRAGRAVVSTYDSVWVLVEDSEPVWKRVQTSENPVSSSDNGWLNDPRPLKRDWVVDRSGRLLSFSGFDRWVLVADKYGNPVIRPISISRDFAQASDTGWLKHPRAIGENTDWQTGFDEGYEAARDEFELVDPDLAEEEPHPY